MPAFHLVHHAFGDLLDILPDAVVMVDDQRRVVYVNPAVRELLGHAPAELLGQPLALLLPPALREAHDGMVERYRREGEPRLMGARPVMHAQHRSGQLVPVSISLCNLSLADGQPVSVAVMHKVAALRTELDHATAQAETDPITGLGNPLKLTRRMQAQLASAQPFALLHLDLRACQALGARLGQPAGDEALRIVGGRLQTQVREADIVVRVQGNEFVMLLDGMAQPGGLAERATALALHLSRPMRQGDSVMALGVHIGGALHPVHGQTVEAMLGAAERAMRTARSSGAAYGLAEDRH